MKTSELIGSPLDWAVAKILKEDYTYLRSREACRGTKNYSTDWAHGGPIIERERITVSYFDAEWQAVMVYENEDTDDVFVSEEFGSTPLIAAMRCYVASKLGDEIEIPFSPPTV